MQKVSIFRFGDLIGRLGSGRSSTNPLVWKIGTEIIDELNDRHAKSRCRGLSALGCKNTPLPRASELLAWLADAGTPFAIATSGGMGVAAMNTTAPEAEASSFLVISHDVVKYAKFDLDLFLAAANALGVALLSGAAGDKSWGGGCDACL